MESRQIQASQLFEQASSPAVQPVLHSAAVANLFGQAEAAQAAENMAPRRLSPEELHELLSTMFHEADTDGSGALSPMVKQYIFMWGQRIDPVTGIRDGSDIMPYINFISGIFLVIFRLLRLDKYLFHMPAAVFEGFTCTVAVIIGLNQLNFAFGLHPHHKHKHFYENVWESLKLLPEIGRAHV